MPASRSQSQMVCHWKVRVWDKDGKASDWSQPALWSMGLLKPEDWQAKWVKAGGETSPWLRKEFTLAAAPERATAFVNVKGYYELYVNGKKVSDDVLMPAVSVYKKRSLYNTYDIGKYLRPGRNCVGVWLGLGLVFRGDTAPLARVQLDLSVGGKREVVGTDTTWTWTPSTHTEFRWGWCGNGREHIDMRRDIPDWSKPGCAGGKWLPVAEVADPSIATSAQSCPPNRIIKTLPMVSLPRTASERVGVGLRHESDRLDEAASAEVGSRPAGDDPFRRQTVGVRQGGSHPGPQVRVGPGHVEDRNPQRADCLHGLQPGSGVHLSRQARTSRSATSSTTKVSAMRLSRACPASRPPATPKRS